MGLPTPVTSPATSPDVPGRPRLPARPPLWCLYLIWVGLLAAGAFAFPTHHLLFWTPMGLSAVVAGVVGVRRYRPSHPVAWYLFYLALLCFITGDSVYDVLTELLNQDNPFPSLADGFYLVMYPLVACGLLALVRARTINRDWASLVDALTITTGLGLLSWMYLILPYVNASGLTPMQRATSIAYPLCDVLVLAMLARLLGGGLRIRALQLLALGAGGLLASDVLYGWVQLHGTWHVGGPVDTGWALCYSAWGAAALHPSMRRVSEPPPPVHKRVRGGQVALLAAVILIAPAVLLGEAVTREGNHAATVAVFSAALNLLVVTRLAVIVGVHRASVRRERVLRSCGESLVSAQEPDDVYAAAVAAVDLLAGEAAEARPGLYVADTERIRLVAGASTDDQQDLAAWRLAQAGGGLTEAGTLSVSPLRYDQELRGMLVVRARTALTPEAHSALAALASQVALALESVTLAADIRQRQKDAHFKGLIQNASDVIVVVDGDGSISYATPSLERTLGWTPEVVRRTPLVDLVHADDAHDAAQCLAAVQRVRSPLVRDWRLRHLDGDHRSFEVVASSLLDDPNVAGVVLTMRDVSERRRLEEQLKHQAFHDALTGLANRVLFQDRAEHALSRLGRRNGHLAMLMLDLDEFKVVNDTSGHAAGDELLRAVANRLLVACRAGDTVARFGGDEFAILMEDVTSHADAERLAQRVLDAFAQPVSILGDDVHARVSGGLVVVDDSDEGMSLPDLLRNADLALYAAKERGKGQVVRYHDDLHARMLERVTKKSDLRRAVDDCEFVLMYQPIVAIETGEVVGAEALVRWLHPQRGLVGPMEFIALAEETGLIVELGRWVLTEACRQASVWAQEGAGIRLSVNVSGRQLHEPGFVDEVADLFRRHDIPRGALVLELTESVLVRDGSGAPERLNELHALGAQIAIDDFGIGYSSLSYLQDFPIDILKIDKSFVDHLGVESAHGGALAHAVVSLAHSLRLEVVAEGIERVEQRDELWSLGCGLGQGYLYARPMTAEDLGPLLAVRGPLGPPGPRAARGNLARLRKPVPAQTPAAESV